VVTSAPGMRSIAAAASALYCLLCAGILEASTRHETAVRAAAASVPASHDRQQQCSSQAREQFARFGWRSNPGAFFVSHYNDRLRRCFIELQNVGASSTDAAHVEKSLGDAQGREYGAYVSNGDRSPLCEVALSSGETMDCHSSYEFDAWAKDFMEN